MPVGNMAWAFATLGVLNMTLMNALADRVLLPEVPSLRAVHAGCCVTRIVCILCFTHIHTSHSQGVAWCMMGQPKK